MAARLKRAALLLRPVRQARLAFLDCPLSVKFGHLPPRQVLGGAICRRNDPENRPLRWLQTHISEQPTPFVVEESCPGRLAVQHLAPKDEKQPLGWAGKHGQHVPQNATGVNLCYPVGATRFRRRDHRRIEVGEWGADIETMPFKKSLMGASPRVGAPIAAIVGPTDILTDSVSANVKASMALVVYLGDMSGAAIAP